MVSVVEVVVQDVEVLYSVSVSQCTYGKFSSDSIELEHVTCTVLGRWLGYSRGWSR